MRRFRSIFALSLALLLLLASCQHPGLSSQELETLKSQYQKTAQAADSAGLDQGLLEAASDSELIGLFRQSPRMRQGEPVLTSLSFSEYLKWLEKKDPVWRTIMERPSAKRRFREEAQKMQEAKFEDGSADFYYSLFCSSYIKEVLGQR